MSTTSSTNQHGQGASHATDPQNASSVPGKAQEAVRSLSSHPPKSLKLTRTPGPCISRAQAPRRPPRHQQQQGDRQSLPRYRFLNRPTNPPRGPPREGREGRTKRNPRHKGCHFQRWVCWKVDNKRISLVRRGNHRATFVL